MSSNPITPLDIAPDKVITFAKGLPGFETCTRFGLFDQDKEAILFSLQCLDDSQVCFTVADPAVFGFRYDMPMTDEDGAALNLAEGDEVAVGVMVYKDEQGNITANVAAPLLFNITKHTGVQRPMNKMKVDVTFSGA